MKPIHAYPSMSAAVRELGTDGFVSAVLRSQPATGADRPEPPAWRAPSACAPPSPALVALRPARDARAARP
jgi:hypothetical protein